MKLTEESGDMEARASKRYRVRYYIETTGGYRSVSHEFRCLKVANVIRWLAGRQSNILNPVIQVIG